MEAFEVTGAAIVLAGGRGSRMGGVDKPTLEVEERSMRASVLLAARSALGEGAPRPRGGAGRRRAEHRSGVRAGGAALFRPCCGARAWTG